jgi:RNA polymerase sigma-70 factor (ECF subfamily)
VIAQIRRPLPLRLQAFAGDSVGAPVERSHAPQPGHDRDAMPHAHPPHTANDPPARRLDPAQLPRHRERLFRAAVALTGSRDEADDLVQETYARVMRRPRFVRRDHDLAYLMRTMRNTWANMRRKRGAEARALEETGALLDRQPEPDPLLPLEARTLMAAVSELSPAQRDAIVAVDVLGLSYKEAARALRTREGTIMSRLFRARVQVGRALAGETT